MHEIHDHIAVTSSHSLHRKRSAYLYFSEKAIQILHKNSLIEVRWSDGNEEICNTAMIDAEKGDILYQKLRKY